MAEPLKGKRGFSLLEALVALAIAGLCFAAVLDLQQRLLASYRRIEAADRRATLRQHALVLLAEVTPGERLDGRFALGGGVVGAWSAVAVGPARTNGVGALGLGTFRVQVYRLTLRVRDARGTLLDSFDIERAGFVAEAPRVPAPARR